MPVPWLQIIDAVLGVGDVVRRVKGRSGEQLERRAAVAAGSAGIEARLAGVVVAALKEAFDRDHQRIEFERQQIDAERQRAERALRVERLRQVGEREIGRLRVLAGAALVSCLAALLLVARLVVGVGARVTAGFGCLMLLAALAASFMEQGRLGRLLAEGDDRTRPDTILLGGVGGTLAPWLIVVGLALVIVGVLVQ
jgi:hypothetical protein